MNVASEVNKLLKSYLEGNKKMPMNKKISEEYPVNEKLRFNLWTRSRGCIFS